MKDNLQTYRSASMAALLVIGTAFSGTAVSAGDTKTIAFVQGVAQDTFFQTQKCTMEKLAEERGINIMISGGNEWSAQSQTPVLQTTIGKKPDLIIIDPTDATAMVAPIERAIDEGIPVLLSGDTLNSDKPIAFVGVDQEAGGRAAAEYMATQLPEGGKVLIIGYSAGVSSTDGREKGFLDGAANIANFEMLPVERNVSNSTRESATIISAVLLKHPDLKGIFAVTEGIGNGAASQVATMADSDIKIIAFDASPTEAAQVRNGGFAAIVSQNPDALARKTMEVALDYLDGKTVDRDIMLDPVVITRDNIDSPESISALYIPCKN